VSEYYERPFAARYAAMGDKAESAFSSLHPRAHRLGLNRPSLNMSRMSPEMRYTPDYLLESGAIEVMGFSTRGNGSLKLKCEKLDALRAWSALMPTALWVYDSGKERYWTAPIADWAEACYQHAERLFFPDNLRPYWNLPYQHFPSTPVTLVVAA
jgi:hypothetical protein